MRLSIIKKGLVALACLNLLVACKYQVEITEVDGDNDNFGLWVETESSIIPSDRNICLTGIF